MKLSILSTTITSFYLLGSSQAQFGGLTGNLSTSCQSTAIGLVTGDFGTCVDATDLVNVVGGTGSIVTPFNKFLNGFCSTTCSNTILQNTVTSIESGCSADLANGNVLAFGLEIIAKNYTEVRNVLCLQATSNNTFCLTNLLTNAQTATNTTIDSSFLTSLLSSTSDSLSSFIASIPSSAVCTDCLHGLITQLTPFIALASEGGASISNSPIGTDISTKCSASFADGKLSSDVRVSSGSNSTSGSGTNTAGGSTGASATKAASASEGTRVGALSIGILMAAALIV